MERRPVAQILDNFVLLSWFFLHALIAASTAPAAPDSSPSNATTTIIVFGDSLTEGNALPKDQRDRLWLRQVEAQSAGRLKLVNEGKGGRPSSSLKDFDAMLERQPKLDALVLFLGTNDSRDVSGKCVEQAVANLRAMIGKARAKQGAKLPILLVGPPNLNKDALGPSKPIADQREANLRDLGVAYEKLADDTGCTFASLFGVVPPECLKKDGVHPDAAGNDAMAKKLLPAITTLAAK